MTPAASGWPRRRGLANAAGLALADIAALAVAAALAAFASGLLSPWLTGAEFTLLKSGECLATFGPRAALAAAALAWLNGRGHYRARVPAWPEARDIATACMFCALAEAFVLYGAKEHVSRLWVAQSWILAMPLMVLLRGCAKRVLLRAGLRQQRVVVFGCGQPSDEVVEALGAEPLLGYEVAAVIGGSPSAREAVAAARRHAADLAVVVLGSFGDPGLLRALSRAGIPCAAAPAVGGMSMMGMDSHLFVGREVLLLVERNNLSNPAARLAKRLFDIAASAAALAALWPALAVLAAVVRTDGGPAFFGHQRIGQGGRRFKCLKFRTMVPDAGAVLERHLAASADARAEWAADRKLRCDPRITRLGRILRTSALDELPQLLNVLRGDMSLVGPRPVVEDEMAMYGDEADAYVQVRPGLTGLWQVSGRNDIPYPRRVAIDGWYVRNWSLWTDIAIIAMTIPALIRRRGAY